MNKNTGSRLGRLMICGLLAFATVATACSSDSKDESASSTTATEAGSSTTDGEEDGSSSYDDWCDAARAIDNSVPSERLALTEAAADIVPEDLRDDYEAILDYVRYQTENPTDAVGIAERTEAIAEPFQRMAAALQAECGIITNLNG